MTKFSIRQGYVIHNIAGDIFAISVTEHNSDNMILLNPVSEYLWHLLESPKTLTELAEELVKTYDIDMETALTDVAELLDSFKKMDVLIED